MKRTRFFYLLSISTFCLSGLGGTPAFAASDEELKQLKDQVFALMHRVEELEAENKDIKQGQQQAIDQKVSKAVSEAVAAVQPSAGEAKADGKKYVEVGDAPNSFKVPGTDTSIAFGGFAKADAIYVVNGSSAAGEDLANFTSIPLDGSNGEDAENFRIHARESRLNIASYTPTEYGTAKVFIEGDFFGGGGTEATTNSYEFRLRHAYGEVGPVLAGQTWSNFMDLKNYPETIDFAKPIGTTTLRQGQIRYTHDFADKTQLAVSLENPFGDSTDAVGVTSTDVSDLPDLTAKLTMTEDWGNYNIRGLARELEVQNSTTGKENSEFGYGLAAGGSVKVGEHDKLALDLLYGDGIGRYINGGVSAAGDAEASDLESQEAYGGTISHRHDFTDKVHSNLVFGYLNIDNDSSLATTVNKEVMSFHGNLIWDVTPKIKVGAEYIYGRRENEAGAEGDMNRVQAAAWYFF
jgi:hypothetical protein